MPDTNQKSDYNKNLFQQSFELLPDLVFLISSDREYMDYKGNNVTLHISPEDFIGKKIEEIMPKSIAKLQINAIRKTFESKHMQSFEFSLQIKEKTLYYENRLVYLNKDRLAMYFRDITENKTLEQELKKSEEDLQEIITLLKKKVEEENKKLKESEKNHKKTEQRFRSLIEQTTDAVFCYEYNPSIPINLPIGEQVMSLYNGILADCNLVCARSYGADRVKDVIGRNLTDLFGTTSNSLDKLFRDMIEGGYSIIDGVGVEKLPNGEKRYYLNNGHSIIENDKLVRIWGTFRDITDRKIAEQKLEKSEEKFRMLFNNANDGIVIVDLEGNIIECNKISYERLGYTREEFLNMTPMDLDTPEYAEGVLDRIEHLRQKGASFYEVEHLRKDRTIIPVEINSKLINFQGKTAVLSIVRDITERKKAEEELLKLNSLKSELLRRTSHELKTPLVSIKGFSDLLLELHRDKLDDYLVSTLSEIKQGCERLENLISDILKTAELESGATQLKKSEEDLSFLIRLCATELKGILKLRNDKLIFKIHEKLVTYFEKEQIHQVISNILSNAIKYTPPTGVIEIKSEINNDFIVISIKDSGIGLTEEEKGGLFKQFGKIERYGQGMDIIPEGSGLGLYISKKIIELHGGEIWVESEGRNKGSTFYFTLPLYKN